MKKGLSEEQRLRYSRQIAIGEIGRNGQELIRDAKVLVIGCGALGSMAAMQLAGAGIGTIGICDFDSIDISNLQRQFFYKATDCGRLKTEVLAQRIKELNPDIRLNIYNFFMSEIRAEQVFKEYDFIIDGTDNPDSKKITGEVSKKNGKACCIGGVSEFRGQIMTFTPETPRFEEFFGNASSDGFLPCSLGGVFGPAAALCATMQASEAIKYLSGVGDLLSGKLMIFDLQSNKFNIYSL